MCSKGRDALKKKIFIILLAAICGILIYGVHYLKTPVNSQKAERIEKSVTMDIDAVFVRDEDVYTAPSSGFVYYLYTDGERIKKGALVSEVFEGTLTEGQIKALTAVDRKLKNAEFSPITSSDKPQEPESAESKIDEFRSGILSASKKKDISSAAKYKAMINSVRNGTAASVYTENTEALNNQRLAVENGIGKVKHEIHSEHSGVFTTILDGLEKVLTPEKIDAITLSEIESVYNIQGKTTKQEVSEGNVMFKIVNNHEWYVLVVADTAKIADYKTGKRVSLIFDNIPGEKTEGKIVNIKTDDNKPEKSILFIQCQKYLEGAYSFRESKGKLVFDTYDGYKVPTYAVRVENDIKGVMAMKGNKTAFYPVRVLYTNAEEGYSIVDSAKDAERKLDDAEYIIVGER